jgi:hypothetical protein
MRDSPYHKLGSACGSLRHKRLGNRGGDDGRYVLTQLDATSRLPREQMAPVPLESERVSVAQALGRLVRHPGQYLVHRWNWKSAVLSSGMRAALFFFVNLPAGLAAARAALLTELLFRGVTSGFYGAITEAFRDAEPPEAALLTVMIILPLANHSVEFLVHWLRGTHNLVHSIFASVLLTALSSLFSIYAMRRGALIVGVGCQSLASDMQRMPMIVFDFVLFLPRHLLRAVSKRFSATPTDGL